LKNFKKSYNNPEKNIYLKNDLEAPINAVIGKIKHSLAMVNLTQSKQLPAL
jgi:hypothetical protein